MNRSILIVICDFLVLSAMSLSMGISKPSGTAGSGISETIRPVTHTFLIEQLEKAVAEGKAASGENEELNKALEETNKLLAQLKKDTEEKNSKLLELETKFNQASSDAARKKAELEAARKKSGELADALAKAQKDLSATGTELAKKDSALRETKLTLEEEQKALLLSRQQLEKQTKALTESEKALAVKNAELAGNIRQLEQLETAIKANQKQIAEKNAAIFRHELLALEKDKELAEIQTKHLAMTAELEQKQKELKTAEKDKSYTEGRLAQANEEIDALKKQAGTRELQLRETSSALERNKQLVDALKGQIVKEVQKQAALRLELNETQETVAEQEKNIKEKEIALAASTSSLAAKEQILKKTAADLEKVQEVLRNDALSSYSRTVSPLKFEIRNDRLFNSFENQKTFYLPELSFSGKTFLAGALETLTGLRDQGSSYTQVSDLKYTLLKGTPSVLTDAFYVLGEEPRIAMMEIPARPEAKPLTVITASKLRKRGLQDLTLFKADRLGDQSATLNGRCSLRPDQDKIMIIRNSLRSSSEVPAEVGDFVITKEGEFAGIVIRVVPYSTEGRAEAWCWIFPSEINLAKAERLPLIRKPGEQYFMDFALKLSVLHKKITELNRESVK